MDHFKLVTIIKQYPPIWDRNHSYFRDKGTKEKAWEEVSTKMNLATEHCKDAFKSIREKYVREREKAHHHGDLYKEWDLLKELKFLDPYIIPRSSICNSEDDLSVNSDTDPTDFDKHLIHLVMKATPIWDRNSNTYPNKNMKNQHWESIATALSRDINSCMLRWKALREKYIRQKIKFQEGEAKWELLDDMSFLDKVIQYRRKQTDFCLKLNLGANSHRVEHYHNHLQKNSSQESSHSRINNKYDDENIYTDSSNDYAGIKEEAAVQQVADSSYNDTSYYKRQRSNSINSEPLPEKRYKSEETYCSLRMFDKNSANATQKTAEQLFGDLVASLLSKKPERERNLYMIEIMTVLAKR
ncbi:uncharacterized protein LOC132706655 [Cylas formicarius]|uniref:uncharacterized protein LOC132706655 n=1 Tax=Cylas formicarius TaxID=197179 RepID=UPI002958A842|nr:uncharacterized protein LOC132706655 [Cylas formicarius]